MVKEWTKEDENSNMCTTMTKIDDEVATIVHEQRKG